ncbi:MAG: putative calcium-binding protein [Fibrobacteres bacterium]|nr:putative calcium-binding protein [Fibrobacterota bacterium]
MPFIEVVSSPANLKSNRFPLREGANILGRDKGCDIEIPDPRISSKHAIIMVKGDNVEFIDQNSTNGIYIDDQRQRAGRWAQGATVFMGNTEMRLKGGASVDMSLKSGTSAWGQKENTGTHGNPANMALSNANFDFNIVEEKKIDGDAADATLQAGLETFAKRMRVINRMIKSVSATITIPDLLDRTMTLLFEAVNCDTGYILVTDPANHDNINALIAYERGKRKENLE